MEKNERAIEDEEGANRKLPVQWKGEAGRSGSFRSLIFWGKFISLTADTARAGAAVIPAWKTRCSVLDWEIFQKTERKNITASCPMSLHCSMAHSSKKWKRQLFNKVTHFLLLTFRLLFVARENLRHVGFQHHAPHNHLVENEVNLEKEKRIDLEP